MQSPVADNALEQRATIRLLHYWNSLPRVGDSLLPEINSFNPQRNPVGWGKCFLITSADPADVDSWVVEHFGSELQAIEPARIFPKELTSLPEILRSLANKITEALRTSKPVQNDGLHILRSGIAMQYRSILLPFADYRQEPRYGLGAVTMREEPPE